MENSDFCKLCPRSCNINRKQSAGFCNEENKIRIAKIIKNFKWEEPCITGKQGCLAIFFSGCNLGCDYCQNHEISRGKVGKQYSTSEFIELLKENQNENDYIDLITPTHFSKELLEVFSNFKPLIPIVWNTNSYEKVSNIKLVSSFVDVFLADLKYSNNEIGSRFSKCKDYFSQAIPCIKEMAKQKPDVFDGELMKKGLIIRHLVLPNNIQNSFQVLDVIKENFPNRKLCIMSQFTPNGKSSLKRKLFPLEYKAVLFYLEKVGLKNGYTQDFESANCNFVPEFL